MPLGVAVPDATIVDQVANNQSEVCSVDQRRSGHCAATTASSTSHSRILASSFTIANILEHEDGGMKAKIQVVSSPF
jgi:hypothetical protein